MRVRASCWQDWQAGSLVGDAGSLAEQAVHDVAWWWQCSSSSSGSDGGLIVARNNGACVRV